MNLKNYLLEYVSSGRRKKVPTIEATDETIRQIVKDELDNQGLNADLNHIDVSQVHNMNSLFSCEDGDYLGPKYMDLNPDISQWDVSGVKDMGWMFNHCRKFNSDISQWNVSMVEDMGAMFCQCKKFNSDISKWKVGKVDNMTGMFIGCEKFNQDLSGWDVRNIENGNNINMFDNCPIKEEFKPKFRS
jgi:surface protein